MLGAEAPQTIKDRLVAQARGFQHQIDAIDVLRVLGEHQLWNNKARERLFKKLDERQGNLRIQLSDTIDTLHSLENAS
jgi:hypothetical protein